MKVVLAFLFVAVVYAQAIQDDEVLSKWSDFQDTYGKSYRSPVEARKRLSIFRDNLNEIEQHNALYEQGEVSYTKGINQFADWTKEEFLQYVHKGLANKPSIVGSTFNATKGFVAPSSIDWRSKNVVTGVKNQGHCGSCWAFSSTGAIEGQLGIKGKLVSLSEQNLIDCSLSLGNNGCDGGKMTYSFEYVKENGIMSEADYPYIGSEGPCSADASKVVTKVSSYTNIESGNEDALLEALVTRGPVSVAIDASDMQMYHSGIFDDRTCSSEVLDHAVLLVGYGSENRKKYYILKNSWGPQWGDNGYIKLIKKHNRCGIASMASIPAL